jgi:hypothetical protein
MITQEAATTQNTTLETIPEEALETEEEILTRQIELSQPTIAKKIATTLI